MNDSKPLNPLEMIAYSLARQINDNEIIYIGTGLPMVAAILAQKTHAPNITFVYESGGQDPMTGGMPWSVGGPYTWRKSPLIMEMAYSFAQAANGYVDKGFLGFAQIDKYGNINTHMIGKNYLNPDTRLTGSGGNNDLGSFCENLVLVGLLSPSKFVDPIDFITSPGHLRGKDSRKKAGLPGNGPVAVVNQAGIFDFEPQTKQMRIRSLNKGVSVELCQLACGFELLIPQHEIEQTPEPTPEILNILRNDVDPLGIFIGL